MACRLWEISKGAHQAGFDIHGGETIHITFSFITTSPHNTPFVKSLFYVRRLLHLHEIPSECRLNRLIIKACSHCDELSEALWRDLIESISNKTSLPVFPFLNTQKGSSVMQFPSTWCPLTGAPSLRVWAAALLQHQHYDGVEGRGCCSMSEPGHRSQWTSTLALHYLLFANIPAGGHVSGYKALIM